MVKPGIDQQIERILDETSAPTISVIVQAVQPGLAEAARDEAERIVERRSLTRARGLLPPPRTGQQPGDAVKRAERIAALSQSGTEALEPLQKSSFINVSRLARRSDTAGRPRPLPLASAAVLEMDRDDLAKLAAELPSFVAVYPNRHIVPPPRIQTKDVPPQVEQRSSHAWGLELSGALGCWGAFGARGQGVNVAVLDTGVNADHPDLAKRVTKFAELDRKGQVVRSGVEQARDDGGHGTHVCGIVAGGRASGRWIGVAPESNLLVCKVLGRSGGYDEQILAGMEWAVKSGADVINMSLGGLSWEPDVIDTYSAAIVGARAAGVLVVAAIGNDGAQVTGSPGNDLFALGVGASDVQDCIAAFSGGRTQVIENSKVVNPQLLPFVYSKPDLCAPGVDIYSCMGNSKWGYLSGTSMACPHVAGAAALLLSKLPGAPESALRKLGGEQRSDTLQDLLVGSVHELGENGQDHRYGWGRLNVLAAMASAVQLGYVQLA